MLLYAGARADVRGAAHHLRLLRAVGPGGDPGHAARVPRRRRAVQHREGGGGAAAPPPQPRGLQARRRCVSGVQQPSVWSTLRTNERQCSALFLLQAESCLLQCVISGHRRHCFGASRQGCFFGDSLCPEPRSALAVAMVAAAHLFTAGYNRGCCHGLKPPSRQWLILGATAQHICCDSVLCAATGRVHSAVHEAGQRVSGDSMAREEKVRAGWPCAGESIAHQQGSRDIKPAAVQHGRTYTMAWQKAQVVVSRAVGVLLKRWTHPRT